MSMMLPTSEWMPVGLGCDRSSAEPLVLARVRADARALSLNSYELLVIPLGRKSPYEARKQFEDTVTPVRIFGHKNRVTTLAYPWSKQQEQPSRSLKYGRLFGEFTGPKELTILS
jgi:hypothetical protein